MGKPALRPASRAMLEVRTAVGEWEARARQFDRVICGHVEVED
jgi:hypothetical protein